MIYFSKDHEWVEIDGNQASIGITDYAQHQLGDIVYVELPEIGRALTQGKEAAIVESVKAASEVYAPLDGIVSACNTSLSEDPAQINSAADTTWFFKMDIAKPEQLQTLMDRAAYETYISGLD